MSTNQIPYEKNLYMNPDSTRKFLRLNKKLFESHTDKNYSVSDEYEITNSGTFENFGSEVLAESRRLSNDRVEYFKDFYSPEFKFYFDFLWSPVTPTINQNTVVQCNLKEDVLLSGYTYTLVFKDVTQTYILRSDSDSDPNVKKQFFYNSDNVSIHITDESDNEEIVQLVNSDSEFKPFQAMFYYNDFTSDHCIMEDGDISIELTKNIVNLPWIWTSFLFTDEDRYRISMTNNEDQYGNNLISFGSDGYGSNFGYLMVYGLNNVPELTTSEEGSWFIKCYTDIAIEEFSTDIDKSWNYSMNVVRVDYCYGTEFNHIIETHSITLDNPDEIKMTLTKLTRTDTEGHIFDLWNFHVPQQGDSDYDGIRFDNHAYGYIDLYTFIANTQDDAILKSAFNIYSKLNNNDDVFYLYYTHNDSKSGLHVDASSDYSDNSIDKKNGLIHSLGDFDGIPSYFKIHGGKTIHRIHAELYSIRERTNQKNTAMDKGTAALIFDTGIPVIESGNVDTGDIYIVYDPENPRTFKTINQEEIVDKNNVLSEIAHISERNVGVGIRYSFLPKFVYHGKRLFSLTKSELDPDTEVGRVYHLSNDSITYLNNYTVNDSKKKPDLSIARICDIPTSMLQLVQIHNISPSIIIDKKYVRSESSFSVNDKEMIWNEVRPTFVSKGNKYVYEYDKDLSTELPNSYINTYYPIYTNLSGSLNLYTETDSYSLSIYNGGSGYSVDDELYFFLGGQKIICIVTGIETDEDNSGIITNIDIDLSKYDYNFDKSLFDRQINYFNLETNSSEGTGAVLNLQIAQDKWNTFTKDYVIPSDDNNIKTLQKDIYGNVWIYKYDPNGVTNYWIKESQLTGVKIVDNPYDDSTDISRTKRIKKDVFLRNVLLNNNFHYSSIPSINSDFIEYTITDEDISEYIENGTDLSSYIDNMFVNRLHGNYFITKTSDNEIKLYSEFTLKDTDINDIILPRFNQLNLKYISNYSNKLCAFNYYPNNLENNHKCQSIAYIYNPYKSIKDFLLYGNYNRMNKLISEIFTNVSPVSSNGSMKNNIYEYNMYKLPNTLKVLNNTLTTLTREELIEYITSHFDGYDILKYEDTDYEYSSDDLIDYIMQRTYTEPSYLKDGISILRNKNEIVESASGEPIGTQNEGWFEWLTDYFDNYIKNNGQILNANELKIFRIPSMTISELNNFRLYNELGQDISYKSILLSNTSLFAFNGETWKNIHNI